MWNLGSGIAKGIYENQRGLKDREDYQYLKQERDLRLQQMQAQYDGQLTQNEILAMQVAAMREQQIRSGIEAQGIQLSNDIGKMLNEFGKSRAGKSVKSEVEYRDADATDIDPAKWKYDESQGMYMRTKAVYEDLDDSEKEQLAKLKGVLLQSNLRSYINNVVGTPADDPLTDLTYDVDKGEFVLTSLTGKEVFRGNPAMFYNGVFGKLANWGATYDLNRQQQEADILHKKAQARLTEAKIGETNANTNWINAKAETEKSKAAYDAKKLDADYRAMIAKLGLDDKFKNMSASEFANYINKNPDAWKAMTKDMTAPERDNLHKSIVSAQIVRNSLEIKDIISIYEKVQKADGNNLQLQDVVLSKLAVYGIKIGKGIDAKAKILDALTAKAGQVATEAIKLKSGAAFSEKELEIQLDALESLRKGVMPENAANRVEAFTNAWVNAYTGYQAVLSPYLRAYAQGSAKNLGEITENAKKTFDLSRNTDVNNTVTVAQKNIAKTKPNNPADAEAQANLAIELYSKSNNKGQYFSALPEWSQWQVANKLFADLDSLDSAFEKAKVFYALPQEVQDFIKKNRSK